MQEGWVKLRGRGWGIQAGRNRVKRTDARCGAKEDRASPGGKGEAETCGCRESSPPDGEGARGPGLASWPSFCGRPSLSGGAVISSVGAPLRFSEES